MKTVLVDLKIFSGLVDKQVIKNTKFNTLKTKVNKVDKKILMDYLNSHKSMQGRQKKSVGKN